jgi:hypothetical protein
VRANSDDGIAPVIPLLSRYSSVSLVHEEIIAGNDLAPVNVLLRCNCWRFTNHDHDDGIVHVNTHALARDIVVSDGIKPH